MIHWYLMLFWILTFPLIADVETLFYSETWPFVISKGIIQSG